jgi:hypothetical protein
LYPKAHKLTEGELQRKITAIQKANEQAKERREREEEGREKEKEGRAKEKDAAAVSA